MKVAICGNPQFAIRVKNFLANSDIEITHFVAESKPNGGGGVDNNLLIISFFEFKSLNLEGKIDGIIIADSKFSPFTKNSVKFFQFNDIKHIGIVDELRMVKTPKDLIYWLSNDKIFYPQLEANVIDSCNLNCKGCTHFAGIFSKDDFYDIESFRRDIRKVAAELDIVSFFLLGGEPLLKSNLTEYIDICKHYMPNTDLRIVTNGVLIPSMSDTFLEYFRQNQIIIEISMYPPTVKMFDKIKETLQKNNIPYIARPPVNEFNVFLTLRGDHNPFQARKVCCNDICRFMRDGKIYKCPVDALSFKYTSHFGVKNFRYDKHIQILQNMYKVYTVIFLAKYLSVSSRPILPKLLSFDITLRRL